MKNRLLHGLLALLGLLAQLHVSAAVTSYPYEVTAAKQFTNDGWTSYLSNSNLASWKLDYSNGLVRHEMNSSTLALRSRLFSPMMSVKGGNRYVFRFKARALNSGGSAAFEATPYLVSEKVTTTLTADGVAEKIVKTWDVVSASSTTIQNKELVFECESDGEVMFMFDVTTPRTVSRVMTFYDFSVEEVKLEKKPLPVTGFSVASVSSSEPQLTLQWTNPSLYLTGDPVEIEALKLSRDGESIATLSDARYTAPGETVVFTDNLPAPGVYGYSLSVVGKSGLESDPETLTSPYAGKFPGYDAPFTADFTSDAERNFWTLPTASGPQWSLSSAGAKIEVSHLAPMDAHAILPALNLDPAKAYRLSLSLSATNPSNVINLGILQGASPDPGDLASAIAADTPIPAEAKGKVLTQTFDFSPSQPDQTFISLHATAAQMAYSYYNNILTVSGIALEEIPLLPLPATELTVLPATDGSLSVSLSWLNPTMSETGLPLSGLTAKVLRDGSEIASLEQTSAQGSFTDADGLTPGFHSYCVEIHNASGKSNFPAPAVTSGYVGGAYTVPFKADFVNEPFPWAAAQFGDKANGNIFTVGDGVASVTEAKASDLADALVSPPLSLSAGKVYEVALTAKHSLNYTDVNLKIGIATERGPETLETILATAILSTKESETGAKFSVPESGDYHLFAYVTSGGYSATTVSILSFGVVEGNLIPSLPENASAIGQGDLTQVLVSFILPTATPEGAPLAGELSAALFRADGFATPDLEADPVATLSGNPGDALSFTDAVPAAGFYTYTILVTQPDSDDVNGGVSEALTITSDYVGAPHTLPYAADFTSAEGRSHWTVIDATSGSYNGTTFEFTGDNTLKVTDGTSHTSANSRLDDWIVTPALEIVPGFTYSVTLTARGHVGSYSGYNTGYEIYLGTAPTVDALTKGHKLTPATRPTLSSTEFTDYTHEIYIDEPETLRAPSLGTQKNFLGFRFGASQYSYPMVEVKNVYVTSDNPTLGLATVVASTAPALFTSGTAVCCSDPSATVTVFSLSGATVSAGTGAALLPAQSGIYVVEAVSPSGKTVRKMAL